ncbi:MAG: hypothetical protein AB7I18_12700 [Candidatus Berkiella sp.]
MLTAFTTAEQITLNDTNRLMHLWDLSSTDRHRLRYQPGQGIEVHGDDEVSYLEDLLALSVHCEDLVKVLYKALNAIPKVPSSLQNVYTVGQQYQGIRSLLAKVTAMLRDQYHAIALRALNTTPLQHPQGVLQAATELSTAIIALDDLQIVTAFRQKVFLFETNFIYGIVTNADGQFQNDFVAPVIRNKELTVARFQKDDTIFEFKGRLTANFSQSLPSTLPTFANLTRFRLLQEDGVVPIDMSVYPKWAKIGERGTLMTLPQFETCHQGANDYVRSFTEKDLAGLLTYQLPSLAVILSGPFADPLNSEVLPFYFQAMVEIAKNHHCFQVELFIPFDFITYAYAFGFYSNENTEQELCKKAVELQLAHKQPISLLPEAIAQFQGNEELLIPVYFPIDAVNTRPVYFTKQGITTTYGKLCQQLSLFKDAPTNSILPDPYGLLARPFCSAYQAMQKSKIEGKPIPRTVASYQQELTDSNWFARERDLMSIGEATHIEPAQAKKTVRILR